MKQKEPRRVERRRRLVELNMVAERRTLAAVRRSGCLSFLSRSVFVVIVFAFALARQTGHI